MWKHIIFVWQSNIWCKHLTFEWKQIIFVGQCNIYSKTYHFPLQKQIYVSGTKILNAFFQNVISSLHFTCFIPIEPIFSATLASNRRSIWTRCQIKDPDIFFQRKTGLATYLFYSAPLGKPNGQDGWDSNVLQEIYALQRINMLLWVWNSNMVSFLQNTEKLNSCTYFHFIENIRSKVMKLPPCRTHQDASFEHHAGSVGPSNVWAFCASKF